MQVFRYIKKPRDSYDPQKLNSAVEEDGIDVQGNESSGPPTTDGAKPDDAGKVEAAPKENEGSFNQDALIKAGVIEGDEPGKQKVDGKTVEKYIRIDGPVGRVFTDILNKVLVNESYMSMLSAVPDGELFGSDDGTPNRDMDGVYVYCVKSEDVLLKDAVNITNEIAKHPDNQYVIAVESSSKQFSKQSGLLNGFAGRENVRICYSESGFLRALEEFRP